MSIATSHDKKKICILLPVKRLRFYFENRHLLHPLKQNKIYLKLLLNVLAQNILTVQRSKNCIQRIQCQYIKIIHCIKQKFLSCVIHAKKLTKTRNKLNLLYKIGKIYHYKSISDYARHAKKS